MRLREVASRPQRVFNKLKLKYDKFPDYTYVYLEGKSDRAFWWGLQADRCRVEAVQGKPNVLATMEIVKEKRPNWLNVVAIIDPDFDLLDNVKCPDSPYLLADDKPDLELTLLNSRALEAFVVQSASSLEPPELCEFANSWKYQALQLATQFGYFRYTHHDKPEYGLRNLRKVADTIGHYITKDVLNLEKIAERLVEGASISDEQLLKDVEKLRKQYSPPCITLCRGKDVLNILTVILPHCFYKFFDDEIALERLAHDCEMYSMQKDETFNLIFAKLRMNYPSIEFKRQSYTSAFANGKMPTRENISFLT